MLRSEVLTGFSGSEEKTPSTLISRIRHNQKAALNVVASVSFATSLLVPAPAPAQDTGSKNMITCHSADKKTISTIDPSKFITLDETKREFLQNKDIKNPWQSPLGIIQERHTVEICRRVALCRNNPKCG